MTEELAPTGEREQVPFTLWRAIGIAAFFALVIFWIWVFANRDSISHPDEFADTVWLAEAEALCSVRQGAIAELPNPASVDTAIERGELVALGTAQLQLMLDDIDSLGLPDDAKGSVTVPQWLEDYELYMKNRRDWTEILLTGDDPPFLISGNDQGVRVTNLLSTYAEVNNMPSCAPSPDA